MDEDPLEPFEPLWSAPQVSELQPLLLLLLPWLECEKMDSRSLVIKLAVHCDASETADGE